MKAIGIGVSHYLKRIRLGLPSSYLAFFVGWWAKLVNNEDSLQNKIGLENPDDTGRSQFPGRAYDFDGTNNLSKTFASGTVQALIIRINKVVDTELLQLATGKSIAITTGALAITGETGTVYVDKINTTTVGSDAEHHIAINFDNPISLGAFLFGKVGATFGDFSARDLRLFTSVLTTQEISDAFDEEPLGDELAWWFCEDTVNGQGYDSSGNGYHLTKVSWDSANDVEGTWQSLMNKYGYYDHVTLDEIPPDMSTVVNGIPSLDALGNTLVHRGQVKYNPLYKKSACALGDGVMYITITGLLTTDAITVESGSDTPTCTVNGRLDIANGDEVYGVTIKRGGVLWAYIPMCEPSGTTFHDVSGNSNHASLVNSDETNFSEQNLFHYLQNYGYSRKGASLMDPNQPLHIPDTCKIWLDGKDASKFSLNGTKVIQWDCKGSLGADVSCAVDVQRPTYDAATGRVTFTSANSTFLQSAAFASALTQPNTIFVVYKSNSANVYIANFSSGAHYHAFRIYTNFDIYAGTVLADGIKNTNNNIHVALFNGASSEYWINGILKASGNVGIHNCLRVFLGGNGLGTSFSNSEIMEVIGYNADISDVSREKIEAYLAEKWDIPGLLVVPALSDKTTDALGNPLTHIQNNIRLLEETTLQMPEKIHELIQADRSDKLYNIVTDVPEFVKMDDLNVIMGEFYINKETGKKWSNDLILVKESKILTDAENAKILDYINYDLSKWIETRAGSEAVTTAGTVIALSSAILYKSYAALIRCFGGSGNNIDFGFVDKVNDGFKITPAINGTVEYLAILNLNQELEMRAGSRPVITTGTVVAFPELPSTDYRVVIRCFDSDGNNVDFALTSKTVTGFTITPAANATVEYIAIIDETTNIRVGNESVTTAGTAIVFSSAMASTNYATGIRCYDGSGNNIDFALTNKTVNGFTITPAINGTIDYISIINE